MTQTVFGIAVAPHTMMMNVMPTTQAGRMKECYAAFDAFWERSSGEYGVCKENPTIRLLKKMIYNYCKTGRGHTGKLPLVWTNKCIWYSFAEYQHQGVHFYLREGDQPHACIVLPPDLLDELVRSVPPSRLTSLE